MTSLYASSKMCGRFIQKFSVEMTRIYMAEWLKRCWLQAGSPQVVVMLVRFQLQISIFSVRTKDFSISNLKIKKTSRVIEPMNNQMRFHFIFTKRHRRFLQITVETIVQGQGSRSKLPTASQNIPEMSVFNGYKVKTWIFSQNRFYLGVQNSVKLDDKVTKNA